MSQHPTSVDSLRCQLERFGLRMTSWCGHPRYELCSAHLLSLPWKFRDDSWRGDGMRWDEMGTVSLPQNSFAFMHHSASQHNFRSERSSWSRTASRGPLWNPCQCTRASNWGRKSETSTLRLSGIWFHLICHLFVRYLRHVRWSAKILIKKDVGRREN